MMDYVDDDRCNQREERDDDDAGDNRLAFMHVVGREELLCMHELIKWSST